MFMSNHLKNSIKKLAFYKRSISYQNVLNSSKSNNDDSGYRPVPHYTQKSALFIRPPNPSDAKQDDPVFSKIVSPELNIDMLFESKNILKSLINLNLTSRHIHLNLVKLKEDYNTVKELEAKIDLLNKQKEEISAKINNLIKSKGGQSSKKLTMQTNEAKDLIQAGNNIKGKINQILEELLPLQEIVNIACLRMPNYLHFSTLFLHKYQLSREIEESFFYKPEIETENTKPIIFELKQGSVKNVTNLLNSTSNWQDVLNDSITIDSDLEKSNYTNNLSEKWSFVEQSEINAVLNNKYLVGTYAKLEQSLVDYFYEKIQSLNEEKDPENGLINFEHIKSVSMFKSAIIEGVGEKFNDFRNTFNVVRFSNSESHHSNIELLHLTGTSSLTALVLNFVRTKIKQKYLPWTVYTNGKSYSPKFGQINRFDFLTLTSDSSSYLFDYQSKDKNGETLTDSFLNFILNNGQTYLNEIKTQLSEYSKKNFNLEENRAQLRHLNKSLDQIFIDYLKLFIYVYKDFNLPIRFVCLFPYNLNLNESFKIQVEAYLPSEQNYVTIGEVSLLNDYISSRLQIRLDDGDAKTSDSLTLPKKHVNMIYCRLVDLNIFTQILIESNLVKSDKNEKSELLVEAGAFDTQNNITFVLPKILKKFYKI